MCECVCLMTVYLCTFNNNTTLNMSTYVFYILACVSRPMCGPCIPDNADQIDG